MRRLLAIILCCGLTSLSSWAGDIIDSKLSCRRFTTLDGLPQMQAETVFQDSEGYIWIGTLSGFARYDGRTFTPFLKGRRENIVAITETENRVSALGFRRQWLVCGDKAVMHPIDSDLHWMTGDAGARQHWLLNNFNSPDLPKGMIMVEDEQETHRMIAMLNKDGWDALIKASILDLMTPDRKTFIDGDTIYVPTEKGLYVIHDKKSWRLTEKNDFFTITRMDDKRYALAADGIYILQGNQHKLIISYPFEAPDYGLFARQSQDGRLFIADTHNLYQFDGKSIRKLASGFNIIKSLLVDKWNRLWMATYQGVYLFFHTDFTIHRLNDENDIVRSLCTDGNGHIVMGTLNGSLLVDGQICHQDHSQFFNPQATRIRQTVYMVGKGDVAAIDNGTLHWMRLPQDRYQFVANASDRLIIGNRQGILAYDTQRQQLQTLTDEIMHPWCAAEDNKGDLWVGSSSGLYRITGWKDGKAQTRNVLQKVISTMEGDSLGNILFASNDSLFLIRNGKVEDFTRQLSLIASHEIRTIHRSPRGFLIVGTIDGMLVARISNDNQIGEAQWFDHNNGFTVMEPMNAPMAETDDGMVWMAGLEEMVSFQPERLLAFDPSSTIIEGKLPWWKQWWAWGAMLLMTMLLCWWLAHLHEQRAHRKAMERLQREKRQKELQIKAIHLKAIPHFHANVLASIEYYLMNNSREKACHYLKMYSDFTNMTLSDIDKPARTIDEELEYIHLYLGLEHLRLGERLKYSFTVEDNVNRKKMLPTMLLYTYCQNAVKHGIGNKAEGGHIDIHIHQNDTDVIVEVTDDGVGRDAAAKLNRTSTKQGLLLLNEQIALYNQTNNRKIRQQVTDLYDAGGNPSGTCFKMSVPLHYQFEEKQYQPT